jgi:rhodanese-related sulfurtransferase
LSSMKRIKGSILQAAAVIVISMVFSFAYNAVSSNGIDPFRKVEQVPVVDDGGDFGSGGIRRITLEKLKEVIDGGGVIIDSRTETEYRNGHIPGAVLLDYYEFGRHMEDVIPLLDFEEEFVIYCSGPLCEDSEMLARELYTLGYRKILVFKGGVERWEEEGLPLEEGGT